MNKRRIKKAAQKLLGRCSGRLTTKEEAAAWRRSGLSYSLFRILLIRRIARKLRLPLPSLHEMHAIWDANRADDQKREQWDYARMRALHVRASS